MPINQKAQELLSQLGEADPNFTFFGLVIDPVHGEIGTVCSAPYEAGQILGFLQQGVNELVAAAANGQLELQGEQNGVCEGSGSREDGRIGAAAAIRRVGSGKPELVH